MVHKQKNLNLQKISNKFKFQIFLLSPSTTPLSNSHPNPTPQIPPILPQTKPPKNPSPNKQQTQIFSIPKFINNQNQSNIKQQINNFYTNHMYKYKKYLIQNHPQYLPHNSNIHHQQLNFIHKIYQIINVSPSYIFQNTANSDIIHWNNSGSTFIIENIQLFQQQLLPIYFRHHKYQSFVRQLNMYDFHKIRHSDHHAKNQSEFYHLNFSNNNSQTIPLIKRKGFQSKKKIKINTKNKPIHKKYSNKQQSISTPLKSPSSSTDLNQTLPKQQNSFISISSFKSNLKYQSTQHLQSNYKKIVQDLITSYKTKSIQLSNKSIKINFILDLAEQIKTKWLQYMDKIQGYQDINSMKQIYYHLQHQLTLEPPKQQLNLISPHLPQQLDNQLQFDLFQTIDQQDLLIQSIFKTQLQNTLIYINSQMAINDLFFQKIDTLMAM